MLKKKHQQHHGDQEPRSSSTCQFYWHRPLGAETDCRRLTVASQRSCAWALPLSLDQVLLEIESTSKNRSTGLQTVELDGPAWTDLTKDEFETIGECFRRHCRGCLRKLVFYGNGLDDNQRSALLKLVPFIQQVELYNCACYEQTLQVLVQNKSCPRRLTALRLFYCASISTAQAEILLFLINHRQSFRSLVLEGTSFEDPMTSVAPFCVALEASSLDQADLGTVLPNEMQDYLSVLTKLSRMRHYYYTCQQKTDLSAFGTADGALAVVQDWWRTTHRPHVLTKVPAPQQVPEKHVATKKPSTTTTLFRLGSSSSASNASTGSC